MTDQSTLTGRPIKIGVVGCGRISKNHLEAISALAPELELVGVADTAAAARDQAAIRYGVPGFSDIAELVTQRQPDIVALATPSGLHAQHAIVAAELGCHVITEKPMATRWQDGKRMVEAFDRAAKRLFVVKQNRLNATVQKLKRAIRSGRFGRIHVVTVNVFWTRPQAYYDSAPWRGTWEFDGGAFMNQASHYVDLLDWLVGPIESVHAFTATLARNIEVEDTGVASIRWRSGALGSMTVTMLTYPQNLEGSVTILGDRGTVRLGGVALNEVQHWQFETPEPDDIEAKASGYSVSSVYGDGHRAYYANVIDALRGRAKSETDGREGLRSLELLTAIYLSARDGRRVSLPLEL